MARRGELDYPVAKTGFLIGLALFGIGVCGELIGHAMYETLPAWEHTRFSTRGSSAA